MSGHPLGIGPSAPRSRGPLALSLLALVAVAALGCGAVIALDVVPFAGVAGALAALALIALLWPFHRGYPLLILIATVPLFPVTTIGPLLDALGGHGSELRALLIVTMLAAAFVAWRGEVPKPPPRLRPIVTGLAILAALGAIDAYANASALESFGSLAEQLAGQPLVFAALLVLLCGYLARDGARARDLVLVAVSVAVVGEALVIAVELLSGGAYDALRGFTRAQGTTGANFVSAFAMMGLFVGMAERTRAQSNGRGRQLLWIGNLTVLAAAFVLIGAVARGGVIGVVLGGIYLLLADPIWRRRLPVVVGGAGVLLLISIPTPIGGLWTDRLSAQSVREFDRPATWISGLRIGLDHPWTGLAELDIVEALDDVRAYRQTPLGDTNVLPHNSWILSFAEGGWPALLLLLALTAFLVAALRAPPQGRTREERLYVAALIGILAVAMINNVFRHPELMVPVLVLVSLISVREPRLGSAPAGGPQDG